MTLPNPRKALEALGRFQKALIENERIYRSYDGLSDRRGTDAARAHATHRQLTRLEPLIEEIARAIEQDPKRHRPQDG